MNKEWKAKWVKALRSGKYRQGRTRLYDGKFYCCLGVLKELIEPHKAISMNQKMLSRQLLRKVGLLHGEQRRLADMNDTRGSPFSLGRGVFYLPIPCRKK
jgi:hypothetical protein